MQGEWCTSGHNKRQYNLALNKHSAQKEGSQKMYSLWIFTEKVLPWHNIDHPASRSTRTTGWYQEQILVGDPSITPTQIIQPRWGHWGFRKSLYLFMLLPPPFIMSFTCVAEAYGSFRKWKPHYKSCGFGSIISEKSVHLQSICDFQNCTPAFCLQVRHKATIPPAMVGGRLALETKLS